MKKILSLTLCLLMIITVSITFCACDSQEKTIVGTFKGEVTISLDTEELFDDEKLAQSLTLPDVTLDCVYTFNQYGAVTKTATEESTNRVYDELVNATVSGFSKYFGSYLASSGVNISVEDLFKQNFNISVEDYVRDAMSVEDFLSSEDCYYKVVGDKIYYADEPDELEDTQDLLDCDYDVFVLTEDTLTITESSDKGLHCPFVLEKSEN